ncbi:hypothetical protein SCHPADRAFT_934159, partial [Schizopora paradoxa]
MHGVDLVRPIALNIDDKSSRRPHFQPNSFANRKPLKSYAERTPEETPSGCFEGARIFRSVVVTARRRRDATHRTRASEDFMLSFERYVDGMNSRRLRATTTSSIRPTPPAIKELSFSALRRLETRRRDVSNPGGHVAIRRRLRTLRRNVSNAHERGSRVDLDVDTPSVPLSSLQQASTRLVDAVKKASTVYIESSLCEQSMRAYQRETGSNYNCERAVHRLPSFHFAITSRTQIVDDIDRKLWRRAIDLHALSRPQCKRRRDVSKALDESNRLVRIHALEYQLACGRQSTFT